MNEAVPLVPGDIPDEPESVTPPFWPRAQPHLPFAMVFAVGAILRILTAVTYRPALLFYGDSFSYLTDAGRPKPSPYHPALYSIFLAPFRYVRGVALVAPVQHLLGLAMAVALYALLLRMGVRPWLAALGCVPVLLDGYQIDVEQFVLAETLFEALVVAAFVLLLWHERVSWWAAALAGGLVALASLTRTVGIALIPVVLVYVALRGRRRVAIPCATAAIALPLLLYATWFQSLYGSFALTGRDGFFLYGRAAVFADCSRLRLPLDQALLCDPRPPAKRPNPNYYVWNYRSPASALFSVGARTEPERNAILSAFSKQVIEHEPGTYLRVVLDDLLHDFAPTRSTGRKDEPLVMWQFPVHLPDAHHVFIGSTPNARHLRIPFDQPHSVGVARFLRDYQDVAATPGPLLALAVVLGLAGIFGSTVPGRRSVRAEAFVLSVTGLLLLVMPVATVMFDYRYVLPALPVLGPAGVLGATTLWHRTAARRSGKREPGGASADPALTIGEPETVEVSPSSSR